MFIDIKIHILLVLSMANDLDKYKYNENVTFVTVWLKPEMHIF